jgi:hypothetical protein
VSTGIFFAPFVSGSVDLTRGAKSAWFLGAEVGLDLVVFAASSVVTPAATLSASAQVTGQIGVRVW